MIKAVSHMSLHILSGYQNASEEKNMLYEYLDPCGKEGYP